MYFNYCFLISCLCRSVKFLNELDRLSEAQNSDSIEAPLNAVIPATQAIDINISHLNLICLNTLERLPALIGRRCLFFRFYLVAVIS